MNLSSLKEGLSMALGALRAHKLRSGLTILGVLIGVTALVTMASLVGGLDRAIKGEIESIGPRVFYLGKFAGRVVTSGEEWRRLNRRPPIIVEDGQAIRRLVTLVEDVDIIAGAGPNSQTEIVEYRGERTKPLAIVGTSADYPRVNQVNLELGRFFTEEEVRRKHRVAVLGLGATEALFPHTDPIGRELRIAGQPYVVIGTIERQQQSSLDANQDDFILIPYTTHRKQWRLSPDREFLFIAMLARERGLLAEAIEEVTRIMRIRHGLKAEEENDFDIVTQESFLELWDQISSAIFLVMVVIASIALMVGGIGVMAIMLVSVTERTREIGIKKALGATRREILWQFLAEAVTLTGIGGIIGAIVGSGAGIGLGRLANLPVSPPVWSIGLGIAVAAAVGIFFGSYPANRAARLHPIEALRYE